MRKLLLLLLVVIFFVFIACGKTDYRQGKALYELSCANCHLEHGRGLGTLIPPLAGSDWVKTKQDQMVCIIRNGMQGPVVVNDTTYNQEMPGNVELSDFQITNIINYINHAWGNDFGVVVLADVRKQLEDCN